MSQRTKWLALSALLGFWIVLSYIYVIDVPPPIEVPLHYQSGQAAPRSAQNSATEIWNVKPLKAEARELPGTPRKNIFTAARITPSADPENRHHTHHKKQQQPNATPVVPPPPPTPPPPTPEELARQQEEFARQQEALAAQAAQQQEQLRRQQIQEQMGQYRYLGYVDQHGRHKAFLGKGREIHIVNQGDKVDGKFQVSRIEATIVKLVDTDSQLETILKLKKDELPAEGMSGFPNDYPSTSTLVPENQDAP